MTRYFLTRLQVEGFRGINNDGDPLDLKFKADRVNSVFGENARGKSSLFDALSYALTGHIPKLTELPADDKPEAYYCNRFHSTETAVIILTVQPDDGSPAIAIRVTRDKNGKRNVDSPTGYANPVDLLNQLAGDLTLLDYATFRRFVEDSPLKRGRAFSALLGLSRLSSLRQTFDVLTNERNIKGDLGIDTDDLRLRQIEASLQRYRQTILAAKQKLLGNPANEVSDLVSIASAARDALAQVPLLAEHINGKKFDQIDFAAIRTSIRNAEAGEKRAALGTLITTIRRLETLRAEDSESTEQSEIATCISLREEALRSTKGPLYFRVYEDLDAIFKAGDADMMVCPACDWRHSERQDEAVEARLAKYSDVSRERKKIPILWQATKARERLRQLETDSSLGIPLAEQVWSRYEKTFTSGDPSTKDLTDVFTALQSLDRTRLTKIEELSARRKVLEGELPPSLVALTEQIQEAETIQISLAAIASLELEAPTLKPLMEMKQRWKRFIEYAGSAFADAEIALSTAQTTAFETRYRKLYDQITRNPDIVPVLKKAKGSEELHLRLEKFHTLQDLAATTLLPESYRNALAISIYLAAALESKKSARFIVFDDVTSSFDAGHQFWLMEALRTDAVCPNNPIGMQVVLLSHDGLLEKYFDRMSSEAEWNHCRLDGVPPCGKVLASSQDSQRVRADAEKFARAGMVSQAKPLIRQYLEQSLLAVIRALDIPVPLDFSIRDDTKAVQASLDVISDALELHEKASTLVLANTQLQNWRAVIVPQILGNFLSHYATSVGASISPHVYLSVLKTIDDAVDCFKYDCNCSGPKRIFYRSLAKRNRKACSC